MDSCSGRLCQLVPLLEAAGLATAAAVGVASLKGVAQFGGRVVEIVFGAKSPRDHRRPNRDRNPASVVLLLLAAVVDFHWRHFTLLMGASQGVITIVRGAVPLALFGAKGYGPCSGPHPRPRC